MEFWAEARDIYGVTQLVLIGGGVTGLLFGILAERSDFCTRSAFLELLGNPFSASSDGRLAQLLIAIVAALASYQVLRLGEVGVDLQPRQVAAELNIGGIFIGALIFGSGMALTRGCLSRLLVLSARGNLRALIAFVFTGVVAWSAMSGVLATPRLMLSGLGRIEVNFNNSGLFSGLLGIVLLASLVVLVKRADTRQHKGRLAAAAGLGALASLALYVTGVIGADDFEPVPHEGLIFIAPVIDTLSFWAYATALSPKFGLGLVLGTAIGALGSAYLADRVRLEGFEHAPHPWRYLTGAAMMGFGGVVAGGCTIGWLLTGGAVGSLGAVIACVGFVTGFALIDTTLRRHHFKPA